MGKKSPDQRRLPLGVRRRTRGSDRGERERKRGTTGERREET